MAYVLIVDGKAHQIIPEVDAAFPGIPVTQRYSSEFLAKCVQTTDTPALGWLYDPDSGDFTEPPIPEPIEEPEPQPEIPPAPTQDEINALVLLEIATLKQRVGVE